MQRFWKEKEGGPLPNIKAHPETKDTLPLFGLHIMLFEALWDHTAEIFTGQYFIVPNRFHEVITRLSYDLEELIKPILDFLIPST